MSEPIEYGIGFEEIAHLSLWTGFKYFKQMDASLRKDRDRCYDECLRAKAIYEASSDTPEAYDEVGFWYRNLTRAFMTYVEGMLYVMRRIIIFAHERGEIDLDLGEAVLVRETGFTVNVNRKRINSRETPNRLLENFVLTFRLFPKVFGSEFEVDYGDHGWEKFQKLVTMRNNLTHPKFTKDTRLPSDLPNTVRDASSWCYKNIAGIFGSADGAMLENSRRRTAQMEEVKQLINKWRAEKDTEQSR